MYDHIGLMVQDLDAAMRFHSAALEPLGHVLASHDGNNVEAVCTREGA